MSQQMRDGGGSVGRVTAPSVQTSHELREAIRGLIGRPVIDLDTWRNLKRLANVDCEAAEVAKNQIALSKHLMGAVSFGPNTERHLENVGLKVTRIHRSRANVRYHEPIAAGQNESL